MQINNIIKLEILKDEKYLDEISSEEKKVFKETAFSKDTLKELLNNPRCKIIVAKVDDRICGHAIIFNTIDADELLKIAVATDMRNLGIGTQLLDLIKDMHKCPIFLEVRKSNITAKNFYEKADFIKISKRKKYYSDTGEDADIMMYDPQAGIK